jgi:ComF family protein
MLCEDYAQGQDVCLNCSAKLRATAWGVSSLMHDEIRIPVLWREVYGGLLTDAIYRTKYQGDWGKARMLGRTLGQLPKPWLGAKPTVVPIPLAGSRLAKRGYNQSQIIAAQVARQWGLSFEGRWLSKQRATPRQATLDWNARKSNLANAFTASPALAGKRILLVDDIMTTGATLKEAIRAISKAQGQVVAAAVIAHVPKDRRSTSQKLLQSHHVQRRARRAGNSA